MKKIEFKPDTFLIISWICISGFIISNELIFKILFLINSIIFLIFTILEFNGNNAVPDAQQEEKWT